jgi:hypothetical protein
MTNPLRDFETSLIANRVSQRFAAKVEPNVSVRSMAYDRARELATNKDKEYFPPLVKAAKAYFDALDKTVSEDKREELASVLIGEVYTHIRAAEATVRVLTRYNKVFEDAAVDHRRLAQAE